MVDIDRLKKLTDDLDLMKKYIAIREAMGEDMTEARIRHSEMESEIIALTLHARGRLTSGKRHTGATVRARLKAKVLLPSLYQNSNTQ
jgi:hypothetical protein